MPEEKPSFKKVISTLTIILSILIVVFYGISFISGSPELTNKFLIFFGIFIVSIELIAIAIWLISNAIKKNSKQ